MTDQEVPDLEAATAAAKAALARTTDLVPLSGAAPEVVRASYATQRAEAARALQQAKEATAVRREEIRRRKEELERQLSQEMAELEKVLGPLKEQAERLEEGLWTVNLYLGRDEQITRLAEGEPAPADEPITLRQLVLAMDEECLVAAESGGIDAHRVKDFGAWLVANPAHLHQVMPERKGVVVLVPSRQQRNYGDPWANHAMDKANKVSHWLIRNGDNVFMMVTDLDVGDRLLPTRVEFQQFFYRQPTWSEREAGKVDRIPLEPGSEEWLKAERASDAKRRHYMRIMLVLQGLVDRTTVFHPLPPSHVNLLSVAAQDEGKVRIVNELDLVLTSGRKPFREWQRELNQKLRPGMRIVGEFHGREFGYVNRHEDSWRHSRLQPERASKPNSDTVHLIEGRAPEGGLVFRYHRVDEIWDAATYEHRVPERRASCTIYPTDRFILPYDLVTEQELHAYLHARTERHDYLAMVPVLKTAIAAKRAEAKAEAPFRIMLAGRIADAHGLDVADVEQELPALVDWWKLANRHHRPLVGDAEAKATAAIEREWLARRRAAASDGARDAAAVESIRATAPASICVARRRDGSYVSYEPAAEGETVWLTERRYGRTATPGDVKEWTMVPGRALAALTVLWSAPTWDGWDHTVSRAEHLTGPERDDLINAVLARVQREGTPIAVTYRIGDDWGQSAPRCATAYAWATTPRKPIWDNSEDPGLGMVSVSATWRRGRDGKVVVSGEGVQYNPRWDRYTDTHAPWESSTTAFTDRPQLVWSDEDQLARVRAAAEDIAARRRDRQERDRSVFATLEFLRRRWLAAEEQRQYDRFMEDYAGAEDLWEGHRKTLKIEYREPWGVSNLLRRLLDAGVDYTDMTLGEAVAADPDNHNVSVPDDMINLPLSKADEQ